MTLIWHKLNRRVSLFCLHRTFYIPCGKNRTLLFGMPALGPQQKNANFIGITLQKIGLAITLLSSHSVALLLTFSILIFPCPTAKDYICWVGVTFNCVPQVASLSGKICRMPASPWLGGMILVFTVFTILVFTVFTHLLKIKFPHLKSLVCSIGYIYVWRLI